MQGYHAPPPALCAAAQRHTPGALDALLRAWAPQVRRWVYRFSEVDRDDVVQEVFEIVVRKLEVVDAPERFPSWLYGVTRNVSRRHLIHARRHWYPESALREVADPGPDPEQLRARSESAATVRAILKRLPPPQREVFYLCELEAHTQAEVAELLNIAPGTVKSRLRLARGRFDRSARAIGLYRDARIIAA